MRCPKCGLFNPPEAQRCDCGYDFPTGTLQQTYLTEKQQQQMTDDKAAKDAQWSFIGKLFGKLFGW